MWPRRSHGPRGRSIAAWSSSSVLHSPSLTAVPVEKSGMLTQTTMLRDSVQQKNQLSFGVWTNKTCHQNVICRFLFLAHASSYTTRCFLPSSFSRELTLIWVLIFSHWSLTEDFLLTLWSQEQKTFSAWFLLDFRTWKLFPKDLDMLEQNTTNLRRINNNTHSHFLRSMNKWGFVSSTCTPGWCRWWRRGMQWCRSKQRVCCRKTSGSHQACGLS